MGQTFLTSERERMLAIDFGLYHTGPRFGKSPIRVDSWWPPLVIARRVWPLGRIFVNIDGLLKTEIVDWESRRIHCGSRTVELDCAIMISICAKVAPAEAGGAVGQFEA